MPVIVNRGKCSANWHPPSEPKVLREPSRKPPRILETILAGRRKRFEAAEIAEAGFNPAQTRDAMGKWSKQGGGRRGQGRRKRTAVSKARVVTKCRLRLTLAKRKRGREWDEWKALTPQQKQERAEQVLRETWSECARLFGAAGQPPPTVIWSEGVVPGTEYNQKPWASVSTGEDGSKSITIGVEMMEVLSYPPPGISRIREARKCLLHEFAHVYQNQNLVWSPMQAEEAAELFAAYWGTMLWGTEPEDDVGDLPYRNRKAQLADLEAHFGDSGYWEHAQFSENWGKDPTQIRWRGR